MNSMKKIFALVLAMLLVLGMTSAMAATISIQGQTEGGVINGHTFKAYKVLSGNWEGGVLTNQGNGNGVDWSAQMLAALNAITEISDGDDITDGKSLAKALDGKNVTVGEKVAKVLKNYTVETNAIALTGDNAVTTLQDGYYIIIDKTTLGDNEVANAALLQVAGDTVTINVKTSTTTVDKKIDGTNDMDSEANNGLIESNDGQVGDLVPYVITATIADTHYYDKYYFEMNDTVSEGLDISAHDAEGDAAFSNYKVYDNDNEITTGFTLTANPSTRKITLTITDAKSLGGHTIKLTYNAKINENAVSGVAGNPNTVTLKYSNNPDHSGDGEYNTDEYTTETPDEVVKTYTTGIEIKKVDKDHPEKVLPGAEFKIEGPRAVKTVKTVMGYVVDNENGTYYKLKTGEYTTSAPGTVTELTEDKYDSTTTKYKPQTTTTVETENGETKVTGTTGDDGLLTFDKLGEGNYTITELNAPNGYNKLESPITFTLNCNDPSPVDENTVCVWTVTNVVGAKSVSFDSTSGLFKITIENGSGQTLPSTGGIGTTLFYVAGSILVLAAVIFLVTKRRMGSEE